MARFTSIGMGRKKFVASAAEEARTTVQNDQSGEPNAGPSSVPAAEGKSNVDGSQTAGKKKRRGRARMRDEAGKRIVIGEKKGPDDGKVAPRWGRDPELARRSKLSAKHAEDRKQRRIEDRNANVTCFACRGVGHAARACPNILLAATTVAAPEEKGEGEGQGGIEKKEVGRRKGGKKGGDVTSNKCYRCNGTDHSLHQCTEPVDPQNPTPYATCYICLSSGHLSSLCPQNTKGVYVNGGACKVCGSTAHRAKDCPDDKRGKAPEFEPRKRGEVVLGTGNGAGADEDDFMVEARHRPAQNGSKNKRHAPARNGERPMKRIRDLSEVEDYAQQGEVVQAPSVPLTAKKRTEVVAKPKAKVVAF
ncbi:zinc knuckle family protein [Cryptococcus neoformans C23]|uniref:Zinc knuckle family protein n=2 Tax=Cryptococcus neoformans TaxID=5207 RepID=A0A854QPZ4_CRYNE|nr:zinc knuckle family protein [Cryptococcus neoformans var. grubii H99]AUB23013.1 zinc knuckle family protein [Cryptococcus neoformans var. grubii]OWZ34859.1 zinc knuckle family protein [Cryptococcus neoformans var. grubii AD2-60a]OWZ46958.1 zinc knuckle family protein [Cryptococcus neoformans var. grubii C23]OWZ50748.1 zinc knuckle family protein [Cryptococcus neoformans var. grubii AD1-83a]OWZ56552.1 zinc knuckle family protein [Cryptococcus neoformans var. grubii 125.91]OXC86451.1 zinc kn|eukprot:XP_012047292.1 zinc knuckle family protein [Cryptococcus neoformans var. grubii H99]